MAYRWNTLVIFGVIATKRDNGQSSLGVWVIVAYTGLSRLRRGIRFLDDIDLPKLQQKRAFIHDQL
jgi:hypothetical protein